MKKICQKCGAEFLTDNNKKKCCSKKCSDTLRIENQKATKKRNLDAKGAEVKKEKRKVLSIEEIMTRATEAGMTYGQYVTKHGL